MRFLFIIAFLIFFIVSDVIYAQKLDYVWTIGQGNQGNPMRTKNGGANIDFNFSVPDTVYINREAGMLYNSATICDSTGALKYYSNGCSIYSNSDEVIVNGHDINPGQIHDENCELIGYTGAQSLMFLSSPSDMRETYLIHHSVIYDNDLGGFVNNMAYSLIFDNENSQESSVILKNEILIEDTLCFGQFTACKHGNGNDWWYIAPESSTNGYYIVLVGQEGVNLSNKQFIGPKKDFRDWTGQAVFSPDGLRYVRFDTFNGVTIFDFDRCSGRLSNALDLGSTFYTNEATGGGVAISPNNRFLYVSAQFEVHQFDLWSDNIFDSRVLVAEYDGYESRLPTHFGSAKLAPNDKIYLACGQTVDVLHTIHDPNQKGMDCNLIQHDFGLPVFNGFDLPNHPNYRLGPSDGCEGVNISDHLVSCDEIIVYPNPANDFLVIECDIYEEYVISNVHGQNLTSGPRSDQIYIVHLKSGLYNISLYKNNRVVGSALFVKER